MPNTPPNINTDSSQTTLMRNSKAYLLIVLACLSAFGPFITDFYLPALPKIQELFHSSKTYVQLSITCSLLGLGLGQLVMGPLSDMYGRKRVLIISLVLFVLSTVACIFSWDIGSFVGFRLLQGIAASGGVVISRSVVADLFAGEELAKFYAMLGAIHGLAPICAPVLGGIMLEFTDWRGIFVALFGIGLALLIAVFFFRESLPPQNRLKGKIYESFSFLSIVKNRAFMLYTAINAVAMGFMFSFISSSSFIFEGHFGLSELQYGFCFGAAALGITIGASVTPLFKSEKRALKVGIMGFFVLGLTTSAIVLWHGNMWILESSVVLTLIFLGMILPSATALAMEMERKNAGNASAVLGFSLFAFGGIVSPLTGLGDIFICTSAVMAGSAILLAICGILTKFVKSRP